MKKTIIAVLVGSIILFAYQSISWTVLLHKNSHKYSPDEEVILQSLSGLEEGIYMMPGRPPGVSNEEMMAKHKEHIGKPWALVTYHPSNDMNMITPMIFGFLLDILVVWLFVSLLKRFKILTIGIIVSSALAIGAIMIFGVHLMDKNWFDTPMHYVSGQLIDSVLGWLFVGLWLGWYLTRKPKAVHVDIHNV